MKQDRTPFAVIAPSVTTLLMVVMLLMVPYLKSRKESRIAERFSLLAKQDACIEQKLDAARKLHAQDETGAAPPIACPTIVSFTANQSESFVPPPEIKECLDITQ